VDRVQAGILHQPKIVPGIAAKLPISGGIEPL